MFFYNQTFGASNIFILGITKCPTLIISSTVTAIIIGRPSSPYRLQHDSPNEEYGYQNQYVFHNVCILYIFEFLIKVTKKS